MHWLEKWRTEHQMSREMLAKQVGVSERLIWKAENERGFRTHPLIANDIADYTGATPEQRDSIVHEKHRGTYIPGKAGKTKQSEIQPEESKPVERKPSVRREIVAVNRAGVEQGRYPTLIAAADAHLPCTATTVANRCGRKLSEKVNEFMPYGVTFRYADEWDLMPDWLKEIDMKNAEGGKRAYGRQSRKVI